MKSKKLEKTIITVAIILGLLAVILGVFTFYWTRPAQRYQRLISSAEKYLADEDFEQALLAFEKAIFIDPKAVDAYIGKAGTYEQYAKKISSEDADKAILLYEKAIETWDIVGEIRKDSTDSNQAIARLYMNEGELLKSIDEEKSYEVYQKAYDISPDLFKDGFTLDVVSDKDTAGNDQSNIDEENSDKQGIDNEAWRQAYIDVINGGQFLYGFPGYSEEFDDYASGVDEFYGESSTPDNKVWNFTYINDDDIPEITHTGRYANYLLSYIDGEVRGLGGGKMNFTSKPDTNIISVHTPKSTEVYKFGSKGLELIQSFSVANSSRGELYYVDDIEVTEDQYDATFALYDSDNYPEGKYTKEEIIEILKNGTKEIESTTAKQLDEYPSSKNVTDQITSSVNGNLKIGNKELQEIRSESPIEDAGSYYVLKDVTYYYLGYGESGDIGSLPLVSDLTFYLDKNAILKVADNRGNYSNVTAENYYNAHKTFRPDGFLEWNTVVMFPKSFDTSGHITSGYIGEFG